MGLQDPAAGSLDFSDAAGGGKRSEPWRYRINIKIKLR